MLSIKYATKAGLLTPDKCLHLAHMVALSTSSPWISNKEMEDKKAQWLGLYSLFRCRPPPVGIHDYLEQ